MYSVNTSECENNLKKIIQTFLFRCEISRHVYLTGMNRFYRDVEVMLGFGIGRCVKVCWAALTPFCNLVHQSLYLNSSVTTDANARFN